MAEFYIITTMFNPCQYKSRYRLYELFHKHVADAGGTLVTIELALEDRPFVVTERGNPLHIQVRSNDHIWYKENLVNVAIRRLPSTWTHVAWLDADISFARPDWLDQTLVALDKHPIVQMFTHVLDLGPDYEPLDCKEGFVYKHQTNPSASQQKHYGQPGGAWAARREVLEAVGKLVDWSIIGSNDYFMVVAMMGTVDPLYERMSSPGYAEMLLNWQERFRDRVGGDIGCVKTMLLHYWHGRKTDRRYDTRWRILVDNRFDPYVDLHYNSDGLVELNEGKPNLRDAIRAYFEARNEDNIEL